MLYNKTATELTGLMKSGECSALDITNSFIERAEKTEPSVDAFLTTTFEDAREVAKSVDEKRAKGESLAPLAGIPIAIKDNICTKGIKTTCASKMLENFVAPYDATVTKLIKENDMPILGKLNLDEFAMGSSCETSAFKMTKNPHDLSRVPGGSSGGSAACVSAASSPFSLGSDTGGSVRLPASLTGVVGLKPTYGALSRYGLVAFGSSLDQVGTFAKSVEDSAMLFDMLAVHDKMDSTSHDKYKGDIAINLKKDVKGLRIGLPTEFFNDKIDSGVLANVKEVIDFYRSMGAVVEECEFDTAEYALATYYILSSAEAASNLSRYDGVKYGYRASGTDSVEDLITKSRSEGFGEEVKRRIMFGTYVLASGYYDAYYKKGQLMREKIKKIYDEAFTKYDVLLTPTSPTTAFKIGEKSDPIAMYMSDICTVGVNIALNPAISVPCNMSGGLPVGFQLIGRRFDERTLFNTAYAYESECGVKWTEPKVGGVS